MNSFIHFYFSATSDFACFNAIIDAYNSGARNTSCFLSCKYDWTIWWMLKSLTKTWSKPYNLSQIKDTIQLYDILSLVLKCVTRGKGQGQKSQTIHDRLGRKVIKICHQWKTARWLVLKNVKKWYYFCANLQ